ncbi:MAG TPA: mandelate racemase/muconate lactonizing enzyme family protein [Verrucomicrobiota bacterium]|nr:mandelate racemase/muconate lactonizing enzyme family protein [Verrucomicrobiota bacterium]HRT58184.1 mandelate racemase/muconate lactonizing enzyme family protein [Candidatus Paceibacterota bacterium]
MPPRIRRIRAVRLYFLPVETRVPLKFGTETLRAVTCARVALRVADDQGNEAEGWGETPLSVQWVWPSSLPYERRHEALKELCRQLAAAWLEPLPAGHALEIGAGFLEERLPAARDRCNQALAGNPNGPGEPIPWLAALVCNSPFDLALHDAYGQLAKLPTFDTYGPGFLAHDLSHYLEPARDVDCRFGSLFPANFFVCRRPKRLRAWHLVGGLDPLEAGDLTGQEPQDGYPVVLTDWIERDGLKCLKVKLRGNDSEWDYERLVKVGKLALDRNVEWLSADFNCTVKDPAYVTGILDRLAKEQRRIYLRLFYVEQPFPYDLEAHPIDVRSISSRKPLFLDESAHDWRMVRLGRELGWTGVALKTCKTLTGAMLAACWAKAHHMPLMVQDLTNPMLAQIPHVLLAAHVGTIAGVETNSMQFYPAASDFEARVHPGLYRRRNGNVELATISGPGLGYRLDEINRPLPQPALELQAG